MRDSANGGRDGFAVWLRTGRWPDRDARAAIERKFNPWHDPDDGRFTHAGQGRSYGSGGQARAGKASSNERRKRSPLRVDVPALPQRQTGLGFGGGGASGFWSDAPEVSANSRNTQDQTRASSTVDGVLRESAGLFGQARAVLPFKRVAKSVVRHGYRFDIDNLGRTWKIEGTIVEDPKQSRSRESQLQAGGKYRLPTDHGGHFIARRFRGPTEAFNHFAQDANFNRKTYARMENQWERAHRQDEKVTVKIVPVYEGQSRRPTRLNIWFTIGNKQHSLNLPNERGTH